MNVTLLAGLTGLTLLLAQPAHSQTSSEPGTDEPARAVEVHRGLAAFRAEHGPSWRLELRAETRTGRFLWGGNAASPAVPTTNADFAALARHWIGATTTLHGVDPSTLVLDQVVYLPLATVGSSDKVTVRFRQVLGGAEVVAGTTNVLFDLDGRLLSVDTTSLPYVSELAAAPALDVEAAGAEAAARFRSDTGLPVTRAGAPRLVVEQVAAGKSLAPRLGWEVEVHYAEPGTTPRGYRYVLDAATGATLVRRNAVHHLDVSGTVTSLATPGTAPDGSANPEVPLPMPYVLVTSSQGSATTDANGAFTIPGATAPLSVTVAYDGPWTTLNDSSGGEYTLTQTLTAASGNTLVMNPGAADDVTAEANALNWIGQMRDWTRATNPADATSDFDAPANVNISSTCNAFYNGVSTNYYQAGGGCVNTAYSSVVLHEMGHWLNDRYGSGNGSDGFGEGNADVFAMYILDDPIVGRDFQGPGNHIRDGRNTRQFCGDCCNGCYGQVHADGEVLGGALWKVRDALKTAHGTTAGGAVADALFNAWMNAYDDGQILSIIETHWLTLDDDDGDIGNGTPNYAEIDAGFVAQGFPGVGLDFLSITNVTDLPTTQDETGPYTVEADVTAILNPPVTGVTLYWRVDGGAFTAAPMAVTAGNTYAGDIPGQVSPAVVEYYVEAEDSNGQSDRFPDGAPASLLRFVVGIETIFFAEDFEAGTNGWTHTSNNGAQDDWQRSADVGATNGSFAKSGDPPFAPSPTNIWGNDLGPSGFNGAYQNGVDNSLRSPVLDMSGASGTLLRFKRWLTVEDGQYDQARVLVDGVEVWSNPVGSDTVDTAWVDMELDVSALVDGDPAVQLEWNLVTDGSVVFGGWNIDDVELVSLEPSSFAADFVGVPTSGTAPLTVAFSDLSTSTATAWSWSFGDGGSSTAQDPVHTYGAPGTYTVALTATGPGGSDVETKLDYVVVQHPAPVAEFTADVTSGVAPLAVAFTDLSTGAVTAWSWDLGDGTTSTAQFPSHVYTTPGTYTVALTATGPGGVDVETKLDYVAVAHPAPTAEFTADVTLGLAPLTVGFTDLSVGTVSGWSWDLGDGSTSTAQSPTHVYATPGTYSVTLTASGPGGSDVETKLDYVVVLHPAPTAEFAADVTSGVAPLSVAFSNLSTGTVTAWSWDFGDGNGSTLEEPAHTYTLPGTYTVSLTADGPGGSDLEVKTGYILVADPPPVAAFDQDVTVGPAPLAVQFEDLSTGTITSWAWDFGDGSTSSAADPTHTYAAPGVYSVALTVTGPGGSDVEVALDLVTVQVPASATVRNGSGTNAVVFQSSVDPVIGTTWEGTIDVSAHPGATLTFALGYDTPLAGLGTPYGELLIANEVLGGVQLAVTSAVPFGSVATHTLAVPNDPTVEGFPVYFQGLVLGGGPELVNALDVVLGY